MPSGEAGEPRNIAADSSRYASTPHDVHARTPRPDASMLDARPPSRPLQFANRGREQSVADTLKTSVRKMDAYLDSAILAGAKDGSSFWSQTATTLFQSNFS